MAISLKYVGDLNGSSQPVLLKIPMNNVKMSIGDAVNLGNSAQAGYLGLAIDAQSLFGVIQGFVHPDGRPVTPSDLPASATTTSTGVNVMDLTISADGDAHALVSVSPTAVYSVVTTTAPVAATHYSGMKANLAVITSGAQTMTIPSAATTAGLMVIPWNSKTGLDVNDSTRLTVVIHQNEIWSVYDAT
jgi:hypothetical protein